MFVFFSQATTNENYHWMSIHSWLFVISLWCTNHTYCPVRYLLSQTLVPSTTSLPYSGALIIRSTIILKLVETIGKINKTAPQWYRLQHPSLYFQIVHLSSNWLLFLSSVNILTMCACVVDTSWRLSSDKWEWNSILPFKSWLTTSIIQLLIDRLLPFPKCSDYISKLKLADLLSA